MSNSDNEINNNNNDFGSVLSESRKSQKYTVDDISRHLKIPEPVIQAIEASDIASLPPPTFTKGYIRAYARFLEISEEKVLDIYNRAVPQNQVAKLKSRSNLPDEKNSQSPLIKTVTAFLLVSGLAAIIYGGFEYYQEKAVVLENEIEAKESSFTGTSLDSPVVDPQEIEQHARLTEDDELILEPSATAETAVADSTEQAEPVATEAAPQPAVASEAAGARDTAAIQQAAALQETAEQAGVTDIARDTIEFYAEKGSWMEVRDARDKRLYYNMLPEGASKKLLGVAPFYVSMGNARTTKVVINGLEADISDYIRGNNTARFKVSSEQQIVVFH